MPALSRADFVQETSTTEGLGAYSLAGAVAGYRTFDAGVGTGKTVRYSVTDGTNWEVNEGVVTAGSPVTLTRATLLASSTGSAIDWGSGMKTVSLILSAGELNDLTAEVFQILVFDYTANITIGDGKAYFRIPDKCDGMNLVSAHAFAITAGSGAGNTTIQVHNIGTGLDMLTDVITIESTESDSVDAATQPSVNTSNDHVATGNKIRIDVDAVSATPPKGLIVTLKFRLP